VKDCIFCRIVAGEIPATILAETEIAVAIADLNAQAPTHALVIPRRHAANLSAFVADAEPSETGGMLELASRIGVAATGNGYRVVVNEGPDGGQTVHHLHLHVLAGRPLAWPPG